MNLVGWAEKSFPGGTVVKNLPANAGDTRDMGSIPGSGRSPRGGNGNGSSILTWKIPWTEEDYGEQYKRFLKKLRLKLPYNPAVSLLGIYQRIKKKKT